MDHEWYPILSRLSWQQLLSFMLVAQEKGFRAAAQRIHLSQSAVSVQVQQLENLLGVALFHRTTRSVTLTPEGAALLQVAGDADPLRALDLQVLQKVLPKFHGSIRELRDSLDALGAWCFAGPTAATPQSFDTVAANASDAVLAESFDKVQRMARRLRENHFVSFAE